MSVSSVGSTSATSASTATTGVSPTNTGTLSFTSVGGFDYGTIIAKLTAISQQQETPYQNTITAVNAKNTELTKIQNLLSTFQSTLKSLSDPTTFQTYAATASSTTQVSATPNAAIAQAVPGVYTVTATTLGTATSVTGAAGIGKTESATVGGTPATGVPLIDGYLSVPPSNGATGVGSVTIDGAKVSYDVTSQSLSTILSNINAAVQAVDPGFTAQYNAGSDTVTFASADRQLGLGSASDTGNLLSSLKLDTAQIANTTVAGVSSGTVTSASGIGGVNQYETLAGNNPAGQAVNANFATPVTAGAFTINGVSIAVNPTTQALSDVIRAINASGAGVTAAYDAVSGRVSLTNKTLGAQSVVVGASGDTSNFLQATGLASGATTTLGTQSSLTYTGPSGTSRTVYANANVISGAVPGFDVKVLQTQSGTSATLTVGQDPTAAQSAVTTFASAYNAVVQELDAATAAPVVTKVSGKQQSVGGGVFYGDSAITALKNRLVSIVSAAQSGSTGYNSLASVGLKLDSSFSVLSAGASSATAVSGVTNTSLSGASNLGLTTYQGTDGAFQPLDTAAFAAAFAANPQAVQNLFTGSTNFVQQLGQTLTSETGLSTVLATGLAGTVPSQSVLAGVKAQNDARISQAQKQIDALQKQITNQANILQTEFGAASANIAALQQQQSYLSAISGVSSSSSSA